MNKKNIIIISRNDERTFICKTYRKVYDIKITILHCKYFMHKINKNSKKNIRVKYLVFIFLQMNKKKMCEQQLYFYKINVRV